MARLSISRAWDEAKAALVAARRVIMPVALGLILLPSLVVALLEPQVPAGQEPEAGPWMIAALLMGIVMIVGQLAIVLMVNGWRGSVGEAIGKAARRTPVVLSALILVMVPAILILSVLLAIVAVGTGGTGVFRLASLSPAGIATFLLGMLVLIYVTIRLMPLTPMIAIESIGAVAAIRKAFGLTRGHIWKLAGFLLALVAAFIITAAALGALAGSIVLLALGQPEPWSVSLLVMALIGGLVQMGFVVVYTAMLARIYAQLTGPASVSVPSTER